MSSKKVFSLCLFKNTEKAVFIARLNRFTIKCEFKGKKITAYLPNPGRLWELLLPEAQVFLEKTKRNKRKIPYTVVAVQKKNRPVVLHTHKANDVASFLIEKDLVPGLEGARVIKKEVKKGNSRFDLLLKKGPQEFLLEVKSCTLSCGKIAMFPDAPTQRGKRHIEELARLSRKNIKGAVLFLVDSPEVEVFIPDYHTDLEFAHVLYSAREEILIIPLSISWNKNFFLTSNVRLLKVPWELLEKEAKDGGCYLVILLLSQKVLVEIGSLGNIIFQSGYYVYVGSGMKNLSKRMARHKRLRKNLFWHIDYLRAKSKVISVIPIRSEDNLECKVARALKQISDWEIKGFGSSDCSCASHLFGMHVNPVHSSRFQNTLQFFRMERLMKLI